MIVYKDINVVPISSGFQLDTIRWIVKVLGFPVQRRMPQLTADYAFNFE